MDLGSGDGRTVITAAKRGARAYGIEYNPTWWNCRSATRRPRACRTEPASKKAELFKGDFSKATVITMFLLPDINLKLRPKILDLKPGTRIVSNTFTMADWQPEEKATIPNCDHWCEALFWIVPAKVEGTWRVPQGDLTLKQTFQMLTGTLASAPVTGQLRGEHITFNAGGVEYTGRVNGNTIAGTSMQGGRSTPFTATKR